MNHAGGDDPDSSERGRGGDGDFCEPLNPTCSRNAVSARSWDSSSKYLI